MKTNIVAFTGLAGCGKSTAAIGLVKHERWMRMSFADTLRQMLLILGVTQKQMSEQKTEPIEWLGRKTSREIMQTLGTEWGRDLVDPDIWVNATRRRLLDALQSGPPGIVLDDARFDNEARMVRDLGGLVVQITRPGLLAMNHASERGISPELVDITLDNRGDDASRLINDVRYVLVDRSFD